MKNKSVQVWLSLSHVLLSDLKPKEAGIEIFGHGMRQNDFAALVDRESPRVNDALIAMSLAKGKPEVHQIFENLFQDTIIALFSRWAHYHAAWERMGNDTHFSLWIPPNETDIWRAILLAMADDIPAVEGARKQLWPEYF